MDRRRQPSYYSDEFVDDRDLSTDNSVPVTLFKRVAFAGRSAAYSFPHRTPDPSGHLQSSIHNMKFLELGLIEPIVRAVAHEGYATPTPIQTQAIPHALAGRDVFGCAQTGTGKTGAFALPILHRLAGEIPAHSHGDSLPLDRKRGVRALILCPTRELASQILDSFVAYGRHLPLRADAIFGGVSQARQVRSIRAGIDILIATPGRLLDLLDQRVLELRNVEILVLDEADRMLDMGFIHDIRRVMRVMPSQRQTLFFSATVPGEIRTLADSILRSPVHVSVARESTPIETVAQRVYMVNRFAKARLLEHVLKHEGVGRTLVFTRTKHGADKLVEVLRRSGLKADAIHGNKSQNARTRALRDFRAGIVPVLVATDIASRGIDVEQITHVINFDMPIDAETYVHRIGRTARAGASGSAISMCDREEVGVLRQIERRTQAVLEVVKDLPTLASDPAPASVAAARAGSHASKAVAPMERTPAPASGHASASRHGSRPAAPRGRGPEPKHERKPAPSRERGYGTKGSGAGGMSAGHESSRTEHHHSTSPGQGRASGKPGGRGKSRATVSTNRGSDGSRDAGSKPNSRWQRRGPQRRRRG